MSFNNSGTTYPGAIDIEPDDINCAECGHGIGYHRDDYGTLGHCESITPELKAIDLCPCPNFVSTAQKSLNDRIGVKP